MTDHENQMLFKSRNKLINAYKLMQGAKDDLSYILDTRLEYETIDAVVNIIDAASQSLYEKQMAEEHK